MSILDKIIATKKQEIITNAERVPIKDLEKNTHFKRPTFSLKKFLLDPLKSGMICEYKRKSPSRGLINPNVIVEQVTKGYTSAGASGLSVLTDFEYFGGNNHFLTTARNVNQIPILRKDFIIDEYQIIEAKAIGADAILLIAECLTKEEVKNLSAFAHQFGLEVLLEVHSEVQLEKISQNVNILGVNNRNLATFETTIQTSLDIAEKLPKGEIVKISESGIEDPKSIITLKEAGYQGFLIGTYFMETENPGKTCSEFIAKIDLSIAK